MAASQTVSVPAPSSSSGSPHIIQTLSPTILAYLRSAFSGPKPHAHQFPFFHSRPPPSEASNLDATADTRNFDDFCTYMASADSDVAGPCPRNDLTWPMSNYFINSSHNTYLTGNQLYSESSTDAYTNVRDADDGMIPRGTFPVSSGDPGADQPFQVLLRGCRCIEIDVWDGEPKSSSSSDAESEAKHPKEKRKLRSRLPHSLSPRRSKSRQQPDQVAPPPLPVAEDESLSLPKPWISASTASRAEPRVLHGYTLTKEVSFREVCVAIRNAAFVTRYLRAVFEEGRKLLMHRDSDLPVIVSLEVHASAEQQEIMVEIILETWAGMLVTLGGEGCQKLPSPGELRRKILVKVKYVAPQVEDDPTKALELSHPPTRSSSSSSGVEDQGAPKVDGEGKQKSSIIQSLSALGVFLRSYHFKDLSAPEAVVPTHVFSLSEKKLMEVHESHGPTLFSHNRNFMMRAFPSGMRVSSSNLDPSVFWRKGVQIVALNWQKLDEGMMLNHGMFDGSDGWVLKPPAYRSAPHDPVTKVSDESQANAVAHKTLSLSIEIFAGQDIPLPTGDSKTSGFHPYVKCELHVEKPSERSGAPIEGGGKSKEGEYKQRSKASRGIQPDFGGERLEFLKIPAVVAELSFLRFKISDNEIWKDDLAAWACIRLDRLQTGYRFVHLMDALGNPSRGVLLVRIEKSFSP